MPPLEALPAPVEEVLRRGVQSLISFTTSAPPGPAWRCHQESQGLVRAPGARQGVGCARQEQPVPRRQRHQQPRSRALRLRLNAPFAGKAFDVRVDGTYATALSSDTLKDELQRKVGLWLSAALPTLRVALERGMPGRFLRRLPSHEQGPPPAATRRLLVVGGLAHCLDRQYSTLHSTPVTKLGPNSALHCI